MPPRRGGDGNRRPRLVPALARAAAEQDEAKQADEPDPANFETEPVRVWPSGP